MENSTNPSPNQNDTQRPNPNSIDGFARPAQTNPSNGPTVSSITMPPTDQAKSQGDSNQGAPQAEDGSAPVLSAPISSGNMDQNKSKMWTIVLIILILLVFVGGIYGVYAYQQKKINNLNAQVSALTLQNSSLKAKNSKLSNSTPTVSVNTPASTANVVKITPLGVSFTVPNNLADLTYTMNAAGTQANLSTQNLATLDAKCAATATVAPLGSVVKGTGTYPASSTTMTLVKQYPTYYIAYIKPAAACSTDTAVNTLANTLVTDFKNTFSTIAVIS